MCKSAMNKLEKLNINKYNELINKWAFLSNYFIGNGTPILIEFTDIDVNELTMEDGNRVSEDQFQMLDKFDKIAREVCGQQMNFRLKSGSGIIKDRYNIICDYPTDPSPQFTLSKC